MEPESVVADDGAVRDRALDEMERLLAAAVTLRSDLEEHEAACRLIIDRIRVGQRMAPVLEEVRSQTLRPQLTDSLSAYERLRHRARLRLIALGVSEGMSAGDIQRHWAITRQLASRALQEIRDLDGS
jgi:hypothetical protein